MILAVVMAMACVPVAFAQGNVVNAGDGESVGISSGGKERASWGYVKIVWANECSEAYAFMSTHAGTAYYLKAKVYAPYSNGQPEVRVILRTGIIPVVWTQILFMKMRDTANFLLKVLCRTQRPLEFRQQLRNPPCGKAKI